MAKNEPQSYGSDKEWLTGDTGQTVNRLKGPSNSQHADFYASRHHDDEPPQGGRVSPDESQPSGDARGGETPVQKVTARPSGAKRQSYWKDRDFKP